MFCECFLENWATYNGTALYIHFIVVKWKAFPRYRPFVQIFHQSPPVDSPRKGTLRRTFVFVCCYTQQTVGETLLWPVIPHAMMVISRSRNEFIVYICMCVSHWVSVCVCVWLGALVDEWLSDWLSEWLSEVGGGWGVVINLIFMTKLPSQHLRSFSMYDLGTYCHCLISIRFLGMKIIHNSHPITSVMASQMTGVSIV